jgi:hypothetical protein
MRILGQPLLYYYSLEDKGPEVPVLVLIVCITDTSTFNITPLLDHTASSPNLLGETPDGGISKMHEHEIERTMAEQELNQDNIDAVLAEELNQMSFQEREAMYEEIHGVDSIVNETPKFVAERLEDLENELQNISNKPAYDRAESTSKEYVTSHKFRLMLLRADSFDARKAAHRLVRFMEGKLKLFGPEALTRPILYNDLDADDRKALKSGMFQISPARDRSGRAIFGNYLKLLPGPCHKRTENVVRCMPAESVFEPFESSLIFF